ncbi:NAD(+) diphosphatase [Pseudemcibacter aquimaris]|uniref:NAD(+) diphosphatase n=1 Tax=Pseudemcibacter aquimaris TaxID=2857064 RepID=UPI0020110BDD|nr:NAD(+) diphosphatase [Pseudemcibacter aquimaris]MCC3862063.1 NAD(+) diphosphatase [Pseudemcibacter aquimaris]WDU58815.1 NAD(+) diphosphatase [Pseudemcibacter aquimaris]
MFFENSCIFAEFPLDPCDLLRGNEHEISKLKESQNARYIGYLNGDILLYENYDVYFLDEPSPDSEVIFLGKDDEYSYFAANIDENYQIPDGTELIDMRSIANKASENGFSATPSLLARGKMLLDWHARHKFCANCGSISELRKGGYQRYCENCNTEHFPRIDPVVIMMITDGDKCLMGRSPHFLPGRYSALAGFMEPGETIEEACRREVLEEAGIKVGHVEYIKSQPWPFPSSLMIGVIGEAITTEIDIDKDELEDARWVSKDEIRDVLATGGDDQFSVPDKLAIARHILEQWANS